jgi:acyl-CoA synthetase (AMP-forming)/AMP-acid ligase II
LHARRSPRALAVIDEHERLTYAQLAHRAWALARGLLDAGVRPGETVGILTGNSVFAAETYLGIAAAGAVAVPYNWRWAVPELVFAMNDSGARVILVERDWAARMDEVRATGALQAVRAVFVQDGDYATLVRPGEPPEFAIGPDDGNVVLYTGGTTGFPKGVLLSHRNVLTNAFNEIIDTDMTREDRTLLITPMCHSASLLCWFLPHIVLGATSVFVRAFDEARVADTVAREQVTNVFLVPNMVRRMLRAVRADTMRSLRRLYVGGATFRMPDKEQVRAWIPGTAIYYQYGLTEAGPIVTRLRPEDMFRPEVDGSIGQEFLLTEATIRSLEDDRSLPDGEVGEICVRGPNVMRGYLNRPDATAAALRGGWLRSGDLGRRTASGYFYFHDRAKDMIKSGGENVYSAEVEQALYLHPAVAEGAVLGVPSAEWDEEVRAVVAVKPGYDLTERALQDFLRTHLAGYKVPKRVAFVSLSEMPINPSGKILKTELRRRRIWPDAPPV